MIHHTIALGLGAKGRDLPKPMRYPRPYDPPAEKPPAATRQEIAARFKLGDSRATR